MSFGFSIGDFIAVIELVGTIIKAVRETGGASTDFRELVHELSALETALLSVQQCEIDEPQITEYRALILATLECQRTMDNFWKTLCVYQPHLRVDGTSSRLKSGWMKIRWATCRGKDVEKFRSQLRGHTNSIQLLLTIIRMNKTTLQGHKQDQYQRTFARRIQDAYFQCMGKLAAIGDAVASGIEQSHRLFEMTSQIMYTTIQIFQIVHNIQLHMAEIPSQVEYQRAVYMIDALGKPTPFHLETVQSYDAFATLLEANFRKIKSGPGRIERGEFVIQDTKTKRTIDFSQDWELCFRPGQRVDMSMIFRGGWLWVKSGCPGCKTVSKFPYRKSDTECPNCGKVHGRVIENYEEDDTASLYTNDKMPLRAFRSLNHLSNFSKRYIMEGNTERDLEEDFGSFCRVLIILDGLFRIMDNPRKLMVYRAKNTFNKKIVIPWGDRTKAAIYQPWANSNFELVTE